MNSVKVYTHNHIGDLLICYGGIKELSKNYDEITIRTYQKYLENVKRLYSSIENVNVINVEDNPWHNADIIFGCTDWWFNQVQYWYNLKNPKIPYELGEEMIFDRYWYNMINMPLSLKWDNFYLKRNIVEEHKVFYEILELHDNEKYIFLHDDPYNIDEDRTIKRTQIDSNLKIIDIGKYQNISILDTAFLIENAKEVHVINSAFLTFIDLMNIKHDNLNYHKYARSNPVEQVALRLNWVILDE
jgi:hypothetical protein